MQPTIISRVVGVILMSFLIAVCYGLFVTTWDFMKPNYDPVASGHQAATSVYNLFGTVSSEIKRNEAEPQTRAASISHRIAVPYAVTASLSAILGGKLEIGFSSFFRTAKDPTKSHPAV